MPTISVVVPAYDVERYLAECLQSIARQTERDLEVVVVDDGSRDGTAQVAERFAACDPRFRVLRQPNRGLGAARNAGIEATAGRFLAFVDSDDVLPPDAYERLLGSLRRTGSDFATGGVLRLTSGGTVPAAFLSRTFARSRAGTHVTRFPALLADRTAWNKLFRREFWDAACGRFPEGVVHEDIPVTIPAHFRARAVDVVARPVYLWRRREGEDHSITQRRLEPDVLRDRLDASGQVLDVLAREAGPGAVALYRRQLVADDLRLHLDLLDEAGAAYRRAFADGVERLLGDAGDELFRDLQAIDRLKWHLLRRGRLDEVAEVVRFTHDPQAPRTPVRRRGRWYGGFPYRDDARLQIPQDVFRLGRRDEDVALRVDLQHVVRSADRILLRGRASLGELGPVPGRGGFLRFTAQGHGRWPAVRMRVGGLRLPTWPTDEPGGFEVLLDARALAGPASAGRLELCAHGRRGELARRRTRFSIAPGVLEPPVLLPVAGDVLVELAASPAGAVEARRYDAWVRVDRARTGPDGTLALGGGARVPAAGPLRLVARRRSDGATVAAPAAVSGTAGRTRRFEAALALTRLADAEPSAQRRAGGPGVEEAWDLVLAGSAAEWPLRLPDDLRPGDDASGRRFSLLADRRGTALLLDRLPPPASVSAAPGRGAPPVPPRWSRSAA